MARFLRHTFCPHCGSHDAYSLYADGSAWCFSCHIWDKVAYGGDGRGGYKRMAKDLLPAGEIKELRTRKLLKSTCEHYGYSVGEYNGKTVHIAPYYKRGKLVAQHLRTANKEFYWLGKAQSLELFGQRIWPSGSFPRVVLTEGELDAMSVAQCFGFKCPAVSIPSGTGSAKQSVMDNLEYLSGFDEVVIAFDNDAPGEKARLDVIPLLPPGRVKLFNYPADYNDANELLQAGQANLIIQGVTQAVPYRPDGIISGVDLWDELVREPKIGIPFHYPILSEKLQGLRKGELTLWTAGSGLGKTTAVNEIGHHLLTQHGQKIGVIALEENKKRTIERYVSIELNKPLHISRQGVTTEELEKAFKATVGSNRFWLYDHWGSTNIDSLLNKLRYLVLGCGVDWIILDHISIVVSGLEEVDESERKTLDRLMTRIRSLIEETGVGVHAVVHLKRPQQGLAYNEGRRVMLTDLRGSGSLEQISDNVVAIEGNQYGDEPDQRTTRVLKNRSIGRLGMADTLWYSHTTGRLLPAIQHATTTQANF